MSNTQRTSTTPDRIYDELLHQIASGAYQPGTKLPSENELKDRYGTSRNTVRLALNRLNTLGILEIRRGDGSYVCKMGSNVSLRTMVPTILFEKHDLGDILEFRKGIEVQSARLAALRATEEDIRKLRICLKRMKKLLDNMREFADADTEMHIQIAKASKNEMFSSMMEIIQSILTDEMKGLLVSQGTDIDSYFYHESILACIENHKPEEAAFMMERHLDLVMERTLGSGEES